MALAGRVVLVTGGGRGIGRELALAFAREGMRVVAVSRSGDDLAALAGEVAARGGDCFTRQTDVASEQEVASLATEIDRRYGLLHVLVNNAALRMDHIGGGPEYPYRVPLTDVSARDWDRMMATNVRGPFLVCKHHAPLLRRARGASVINVSAGAGIRGQAGRAPYSAAKFALEGLTQALAEEWRGDAIAVNTLEPGGSVLTDETKRELVAGGSSHRFLDAAVMVPPALHLASADADSPTGTHVNALEWVLEHGLGPRERWFAR